MDPISIAGGINLYAYVRNDPLRSVDPLGYEALSQGECCSSSQLDGGDSLQGASQPTYTREEVRSAYADAYEDW